mgnify:CR=1 FL=1
MEYKISELTDEINEYIKEIDGLNQQIDKLKKENLNFYNFIPKAGQVVLFESWLRHEVCQNTTNKNRISISFNYDWV